MNRVKIFLKDMGNLLLDTETSDVVLLCQGEEIRVHRSILGARSPVFRAMLQSQMLESTKGEVRIEDADKDVLKEMLSYVYKIEVNANFTKFKELLVLADKYQIDDLVRYCEERIIETLTYENAFKIGILAETHNAPGLLDECIKCILDNVPHSLEEDWMETIKESPKMKNKIINCLIESYIESRIFEIKRQVHKLTVGEMIDTSMPLLFK